MILRYWDIDMKDYPDIRIFGNWGYEILKTLNIEKPIKMNKDILWYGIIVKLQIWYIKLFKFLDINVAGYCDIDILDNEILDYWDDGIL